MNEIVKEELWRSIAVFFFALIFVGMVTTKLEIEGSFFTVIGVPLLITFAHFMIKIYIRRGEAYQPPKWSAKFAARFFVLLSLTFIVFWLMGFALNENVSDKSFILLGLYFSLFALSLIWYYKVKGGERGQC